MKHTLLALVLSLLTPALRADEVAPEILNNWHQWRGPLATGAAPRGDPPTTWNDKTNIKWKTPIPGKGSATPIIWGDRIFILTALDTGRKVEPKDLPKTEVTGTKKTQPPTTYHQFIVLCLERKSGKMIWQQVATEQVPHEGIHPTHSYAAGSPTTDGKYLYVSFGSRGIFCYDLDGKLQWQRDLGDMDTRFGWGEGGSPALHGDSLIVNWDHEGKSFITSLDARTGKERWKVDRDERTSWSTPLVVPHKGRTQVVVNAYKKVRSYDLKTGEVIWQCGGQTEIPIPCPIARGDVVYCMTGYRGAAAFAIPLDATGDVTDSNKLVWRFDKSAPYVPSAVLAGDRLYFTNANNPLLTCLDATSGKPLFDRERLKGLESLYASPVAAAGRLYFVGRDGTTVVLKQSDKVEILATNRLNDPIDASPAIVGKQLFLRGEKNLYCIESP